MVTKSKSKTNGKSKKSSKGLNNTEVVFPIDHVEKISEIEALRFRALDAEIRNHLQGIRIIDLEIIESKKKFEEETRQRVLHKADLQAMVDSQRIEYDALINQIANDHDLDPKQMAIDPEARTLRDLRTEIVIEN